MAADVVLELLDHLLVFLGREAGVARAALGEGVVDLVEKPSAGAACRELTMLFDA